MESTVIVLRVDRWLKRAIRHAATDAGMSISSFLIEAASIEIHRLRKGGLPYMKPADRFLREVQRGGPRGYRQLGRVDAHVATACGKKPRREIKDDARLLAWFDRNVPGRLAQVPARKRAAFVRGIREGLAETCHWKMKRADDGPAD